MNGSAMYAPIAPEDKDERKRVPIVEVAFEFPTKYEDDGILGDQLWKQMMPIGAGFVRVPNPRQDILYIDDTPASLFRGLRDVIVKYSRGDKSRFAGGGHEYHCLDYSKHPSNYNLVFLSLAYAKEMSVLVRQSILCAGDTTLDYANVPDGTGRATGGFSGAGSKHQCRDWNIIRDFLIENSYQVGGTVYAAQLPVSFENFSNPNSLKPIHTKATKKRPVKRATECDLDGRWSNKPLYAPARVMASSRSAHSAYTNQIGQASGVKDNALSKGSRNSTS
ncbi:hypothetical protein B7463_g5374, partial [Scytalidium lignicola]